MIINLKTNVNRSESTRVKLELSERLPFYIVPECVLNCDYSIQTFPEYALMTLDVSGNLKIECQRCLDIFDYPYVNHTELAICRDEPTAEKWMEHYECIVSNSPQIDLQAIVTDELHLYAPQKHAPDCL
jgi:uncharacterized protein